MTTFTKRRPKPAPQPSTAELEYRRAVTERDALRRDYTKADDALAAHSAEIDRKMQAHPAKPYSLQQRDKDAERTTDLRVAVNTAKEALANNDRVIALHEFAEAMIQHRGAVADMKRVAAELRPEFQQAVNSLVKFLSACRSIEGKLRPHESAANNHRFAVRKLYAIGRIDPNEPLPPSTPPQDAALPCDLLELLRVANREIVCSHSQRTAPEEIPAKFPLLYMHGNDALPEEDDDMLPEEDDE